MTETDMHVGTDNAESDRSRRGERGATAIEMAFLTVLLVVPTSMAVERFQDRGRDNIVDAGQRIGLPEEHANTVTVGSTPAPPSGTGGSGTSGNEASLTASGSATTQGSKKWTAVAELEAVTAAGSPILDAEITGTWLILYEDGTSATESAQCSTDSSGVCTMSRWNLWKSGESNGVQAVVFTVDGLTAEGVTPAPGVIGTSVIVASP